MYGFTTTEVFDEWLEHFFMGTVRVWRIAQTEGLAKSLG